MTWVKGTTTWANLASDLTKLACGEMADGQGAPVTVSVGDRWLREYDTTVDAIRSPASKDVNTGACSMRAGYWACVDANTNAAGHQTSVRQTSVRTGNLTQRVCYNVYYDIANTAAGDYSTARCRVRSWDMDTGNYIRNNDVFTPSAAGDVTVDGMTFRVSNPAGIVPINVHYFRQFTPTYPGGIDWWPMYPRRSAAATFSTAPPGVAGTDYDIVEDTPPFGYCGNDGSVSSNTNAGSSSNWNRGGFGSGLGIKTVAGLTGAVYVCSFPMALHKVRLFNRTDVAGILAMTYGRMGLDGAVYRQNMAHEVSSWARPFQTAAQVVSGSVISYWMQVKPDSIVVVLSGDPGVTGKVTMATIGTLTPYDPAYDVLPVIYSGNVNDYTADNGTNFGLDVCAPLSYWSLRKRQDGTEGARDWQTKWMRADIPGLGAAWSGAAFTWDLAANESAWGVCTSTVSGLLGHPNILPLRQLKPHPYDARWWLYGVAYGDGAAWDASTTPANPGTLDNRQIRGVANTRWWFLPGDGWANLDELTDTSNGNKYLLVAADYVGAGGRHRVSSSTYTGGIAIAEV